jgi:hypothetical protein
MRGNLSSDAMKTVRDNPIAGDIGGNSMRATTVSSLTFDAGFTLSGLLSGQNDRLERTCMFIGVTVRAMTVWGLLCDARRTCMSTDNAMGAMSGLGFSLCDLLAG